MKHYSISYKKPGDDRIYHTGEFAKSASEARQKAKARWGDIRILSCVEG